MNVYLIQAFSLRILHDEIQKITGQSSNVIRMNLDEITIEDVIGECAYYSLLDEQKYVIVGNFKFTKENSILNEYFKNPNPQTTLILIADSIDRRSTVYKAINDLGHIIIIDQIKDLTNKINLYAKSNGLTIDYLAIGKLLENNLDNYDLVLNEIDKISLMTNNITLDHIKAYSYRLVAEDNFEFCDAIIKKDYALIDRSLTDFINLKCELAPFLALLAGQYRIIYAVKCLTGSNEEIAKKIEVHPYRVKLAKEKSLMYSKDEIQKKLLDLCDLDYQIKTSNIDKYLLFKIFLVNL